MPGCTPEGTLPIPREDGGVIDLRQRRGTQPPAAIFLLCLLSGACGGPATDPEGWCAGVSSPATLLPALDMEDPGVSRRNLRAWVELLASPELAGRHAGDPGADVAAGLLAAQMARYGLEPPRPGAGYCQGFPFFDAENFNVAGRLPPPARGDSRGILVSAHYDGQGAHPAGMIYPGADDNASGVAALLEVARLAALAATGTADAGPPADGGIAWTFAALGAEETGRLGAHAYLGDPAVAWSRIELAVNLDMVGRPFPGEPRDAIGYLVLGDSPGSTLAHLQAAARRQGIEVRSLEGDLRPAISDAYELASRLPTLLLSTAIHEDHHQLTDTPERIDYGQVERAARLVLDLADIIAAGR